MYCVYAGHQLCHNSSVISTVHENVAMKMEYIRLCRLFSIASIQILFRLRLLDTGMKSLQLSHFSISSWNLLRMLSWATSWQNSVIISNNYSNDNHSSNSGISQPNHLHRVSRVLVLIWIFRCFWKPHMRGFQSPKFLDNEDFTSMFLAAPSNSLGLSVRSIYCMLRVPTHFPETTWFQQL